MFSNCSCRSIKNINSPFSVCLQTIISTTSTLSISQAAQQTSLTMGAPSNGSKTAHSKVANGTNAGTSGNTNQTTSKRSSSGADGDYQLVQHEVLYSQSSQYEVSCNSLLRLKAAWQTFVTRKLQLGFHWKSDYAFWMFMIQTQLLM